MRWEDSAALYRELEFLQASLPFTPRLIHIMAEASKTEWGSSEVEVLPDGLEGYIETVVHPSVFEARSTNLPPTPHPLFGREPEIDAVLQHREAGARLITLKGLICSVKLHMSRHCCFFQKLLEKFLD